MATPAPMYPFRGSPYSRHAFTFGTQQPSLFPQSAVSAGARTFRSTNVDDVRSQEGLKMLRNPTSVLMTVGDANIATSWSIPKNLLTHHLPFFNTIIKDNKVALPEEDPNIFELLVQWLYVGGVSTVASNSEPYVKAWILGNKLQCPTFRDHAMLQILHCHMRGDYPEQPISPLSLRLAYSQTQSESKLRQWALDQFMFNSSKGIMSARIEEWAPVLEEVQGLEKEMTCALMKHGNQGIQNPYKQGKKYMEVLKHGDSWDHV